MSLSQTYQNLVSDPRFHSDPDAQDLAAKLQAKAAPVYQSLVSGPNFKTDTEAQQLAHQLRASGIVNDPTQGGLANVTGDVGLLGEDTKVTGGYIKQNRSYDPANDITTVKFNNGAVIKYGNHGTTRLSITPPPGGPQGYQPSVVPDALNGEGETQQGSNQQIGPLQKMNPLQRFVSNVMTPVETAGENLANAFVYPISDILPGAYASGEHEAAAANARAQAARATNPTQRAVMNAQAQREDAAAQQRSDQAVGGLNYIAPLSSPVARVALAGAKAVKQHNIAPLKQQVVAEVDPDQHGGENAALLAATLTGGALHVVAGESPVNLLTGDIGGYTEGEPQSLLSPHLDMGETPRPVDLSRPPAPVPVTPQATPSDLNRDHMQGSPQGTADDIARQQANTVTGTSPVEPVAAQEAQPYTVKVGANGKPLVTAMKAQPLPVPSEPTLISAETATHEPQNVPENVTPSDNQNQMGNAPIAPENDTPNVQGNVPAEPVTPGAPAGTETPTAPASDGKPEYAGSTNLDRLNVSDEAQQVIRDAAKRLPQSPVKSHASVEDASRDLADRLDQVIDKLQPGELPTEADGTRLHAADVWTAARRLTARYSELVADADRQYQENPTAENKAALDKAVADQFVRQRYSAEVGRESGQTQSSGNINVGGDRGQAISDRLLRSPSYDILNAKKSGSGVPRGPKTSLSRKPRWQPVSEDDYSAARDRLRSITTQYDSVAGAAKAFIKGEGGYTDIDVLKEHAEDIKNVGLYHLAKGVNNFMDWAEAMKSDIPLLAKASRPQLEKLWQDTRIAGGRNINRQQVNDAKAAVSDGLIPMLGDREHVSKFIEELGATDPATLEAWMQGDKLSPDQEHSLASALVNNKKGKGNATPRNVPDAVKVARDVMAEYKRTNPAKLTPEQQFLRSLRARVTTGSAEAIYRRVMATPEGAEAVQKVFDGIPLTKRDEEVIANAIKPALRTINRVQANAIANRLSAIMRDARSGRLGGISPKEQVRQIFTDEADRRLSALSKSRLRPDRVEKLRGQIVTKLQGVNNTLAGIDPQDVNRLANVISKYDSEGWERAGKNLSTYYRGDVLSNTFGLPAIAISHLAALLGEKGVIQPVTTLIDILGEKFGIPRTTAFNPADTLRSLGSIPSGLKGAGRILVAGENALHLSGDNPVHVPLRKVEGEFNLGLDKLADSADKRFGSPEIGRALRVVNTVLGAPTRFFNRQHGALFHAIGTPIFDDLLREQALVRAMNEHRAGLIDRHEIGKRAVDLYNSPTVEMEDLAGIAHSEQMFSTENKLVRALESSKDGGFLGMIGKTVVAPVLKIPSNIAGRVIESQGWGMFKGGSILMRAWKGEDISPAELANAKRAIARSVVGIATTCLAYKSVNQYLHGVNAKKHQYATTVDAAGHRTELSRIMPALGSAAIGLAARDSERKGIPAFVSRDTVNAGIGDAPYLRQDEAINSLLDTTQSDQKLDQKLSRIDGATAANFIPASSLLRAVSASTDPTSSVRVRKSGWDEIADTLPGKPRTYQGPDLPWIGLHKGQALTRQALPVQAVRGVPVPEGGGMKILRSVPLQREKQLESTTDTQWDKIMNSRVQFYQSLGLSDQNAYFHARQDLQRYLK